MAEEETKDDEKVRQILDKVKSRLETTDKVKFTSLDAISCETGVVAGTNYFIKAKGVTEAGDEKIVCCFSGSVKLSFFDEDDREYFGDVVRAVTHHKVQLFWTLPEAGKEQRERPTVGAALGKLETEGPDPKINELVEKVRPTLEDSTGHRFSSLEVFSVNNEQVADGTKYHVKCKGLKFNFEIEMFIVHLRIHENSSGQLELENIHLEPIED